MSEYTLWVTVETVTEDGRSECDFPQQIGTFTDRETAEDLYGQLDEEADGLLNQVLVENVVFEKLDRPCFEVLLVIEKHEPGNDPEHVEEKRTAVAAVKYDEENRAYDAMLALAHVGVKWL